MIVSVDVQYRNNTGYTAGVAFEHWESPNESEVFISTTDKVRDYVPGEFFKRELPCILNLLSLINRDISCIVIDGHVFLDGEKTPGLGKHLYDELGEKIPIIGVAKSSFGKMDDVYKISRGGSSRGLYITSAGLPLNKAKMYVESMHGPHRIPYLLKLTDKLCRQAAQPPR